jgi:hypothetical protein
MKIALVQHYFTQRKCLTRGLSRVFIGKLGLKPCPSRAALYSNLTTNTANLILEINYIRAKLTTIVLKAKLRGKTEQYELIDEAIACPFLLTRNIAGWRSAIDQSR